MITMLKNWTGPVEVNGNKSRIEYISHIPGPLHIVLGVPLTKVQEESTSQSDNSFSETDTHTEYRITVKQYMTKPATPEFDFMAKWNEDKPMPMRIMQGYKVKETRGMVYMKLHGFGAETITCSCCGKELTNPISRYYGIGPVCLSKIGIARDIEDVANIKEDLVNITWEGWIIKSAIQEMTEVTNEG